MHEHMCGECGDTWACYDQDCRVPAQPAFCEACWAQATKQFLEAEAKLRIELWKEERYDNRTN